MKRSTKTTDKKKALKLAEKFEEESRAVRTAKQARRVLTAVYKDLLGAQMATSTVREHFDGYIKLKTPEISVATADYYSGHSKRFLTWLRERADDDIALVTTQDIADYRSHIARQAGPRTVNNSLKAIRTFFGAAKKDGFVADDPTEGVGTIKDTGEATRRPFTLDEIKSVLAASNPEWKSMVKFGFYLGQRLGDIAALTWKNIDLTRKQINLTTRKTSRKQELPLPAPLLAHLLSVNDGKPGDGPLHPHAYEVIQKFGRVGILSKEFAEILNKAGLRFAVAAAKGEARAKHELSFHCLRHTATTLLKDGGIPSSTVMHFIGHSTGSVSDGYTHPGTEALEKAAAAFPEI